jgi:hypothetical protein
MYGSCAVNTTWCTLLGANPFLRQICVGSGVPGNGFAALQRAHAQSLLGITVTPETTPSMVS